MWKVLESIEEPQRVTTEMNDPIEVDRIIAEQHRAANAEQQLNEASSERF